jgi:hypothetical protein
MPNRSTQIDDELAGLALSLVDLRAHFEAQLRKVVRAEQCLAKCRSAHDAASFDTAAETLRRELQAVVDNRRSVGDLVEQVIAAARRLTIAG